MLLCDDLNRLVDAIDAGVETSYSRQADQNQQSRPEVIARDFLQMRGQHRTDIFGYTKTSRTQTIHQTSEDVTPGLRRRAVPGRRLHPADAGRTSSRPRSRDTRRQAGATRSRSRRRTRRCGSASTSRGRATPVRARSARVAGPGLLAAPDPDGRSRTSATSTCGSSSSRAASCRASSGPAKGRAGGDVDGDTTAGGSTRSAWRRSSPTATSSGTSRRWASTRAR